MGNKFIKATCGADTQIIQQGASERAQRADEAYAAATEQRKTAFLWSYLSTESNGLHLLVIFRLQYKFSTDNTFGTMLIKFMVTLEACIMHFTNILNASCLAMHHIMHYTTSQILVTSCNTL